MQLSSRYTKALENIKSLRKDQAGEIKLGTERISYLDVEKNRADELTKPLESTKASIESVEAVVTQIRGGCHCTNLWRLSLRESVEAVISESVEAVVSGGRHYVTRICGGCRYATLWR
jgi:hypothetical protein